MSETKLSKRIYKQIMCIYFYPYLLVSAFHCYAFEHYGMLMVSMALMTMIAILSELHVYLLSKTIKLIKDE